MKSTTAYYLILLYSIAMCKPIIPVLGDFLAHTLWQEEHLQTVHQEHGKNHVHYELMNAAKNEQKDNEPQSTKLSDNVSVHIPTNYQFDFSCLLIVAQKQDGSCKHIPHPVIDLLIPPPRI